MADYRVYTHKKEQTLCADFCTGFTFLRSCNKKIIQKVVFTSEVRALTGINMIIIITMYIYHALINALSAHMIHINLNMIFYM